jgi:hypothetical protein
MFENQNVPASPADKPAGNTNQGTGPSVQPASSSVLSGVNSGVSPAAAKPTTPADMFSEVEPAPSTPPVSTWQRPTPPKPAVFQPKPSAPSATPGSPAGGSYNFPEADPGFNLKRILVLGGLIVALGAIAGGGYYGYKKYSAVSPINAPANNNNTENKEITNVQPADTKPEATTDTNTVVPNDNTAASGTAVVAPPKDSDDDGLTDEEEASLGTNPNAVDSDNDGLFDREEVKVYGTDPLRADTDGDGYSDGVEVKGGFNPLGWGKLFDPANPAANKQ